MKKLLIIQLDEAYFLFETFQMLDRYRDALKDFDITVLANPKSLTEVQDGSSPIISGVTTNVETVLSTKYDVSANFSLNDASWPLHHKVTSDQKLGPYEQDGQLLINDQWSTYLLTLKARAPFLTFHMQDIYKNILGIKKAVFGAKEKKNYQQIVFGLSNTDFFSAEEQEKLLEYITIRHSNLHVKDISEIDMVSDLSQVLYIGPATFDSLKICEDGATGIFLSSQFQGFNLLPHQDGHFFISSRNGKIHADKIFAFIETQITHKNLPENFPYAIYLADNENLFGSYMRSLNASDDNYPVYQAHVVLWNFILNLFDVNLDITECTASQNLLLKTQTEVLNKLLRLHDYAMSSIDIVLKETKSLSMDTAKVQGHLKNLREIEEISDKISQSNIFLRPILDFYRMRRGQNSGTSLADQAEHTFLLYSEEHQALQAILELFTVTLQKNEVNI